VCIDCHGVHDMRQVDDPKARSSKRICSPPAKSAILTPRPTSHFVDQPLPAQPERAPLVYFVNLFYAVFIPALLGGMAFFVVTDAAGELSTVERSATMAKAPLYPRFSISDRVEHWVLTLSFGLLALTGIVQSLSDGALATWIIGLLGGIENSRTLHHWAAIVLMLQTIYHLGMLGYKVFVLRVPMSMLPGVEDLRNAWQFVRYTSGPPVPARGKAVYLAEKLEYWAVPGVPL